VSFVDPRPDVSIGSLQALNDDFLYFNVAGSGPTFPIAQRVAEASLSSSAIPTVRPG
jgi:hypothetical protein